MKSNNVIMKKCDACNCWSQFGETFCKGCGSPLDYTAEMSLPKYVVRGAESYAKVDFASPGGVITCDTGVEITPLEYRSRYRVSGTPRVLYDRFLEDDVVDDGARRAYEELATRLDN